MQQQIEEALESSDLTNLKASVTPVFLFKAEVKPTSTCTSKMILFKRKNYPVWVYYTVDNIAICLTEIYYWLLFMEVQMKRIASCFIYGDSGKKVIMHFFFLLTCCLTLMVLTTLTLVGVFFYLQRVQLVEVDSWTKDLMETIPSLSQSSGLSSNSSSPTSGLLDVVRLDGGKFIIMIIKINIITNITEKHNITNNDFHQ